MRLGDLAWGDEVIVHGFNAEYGYQVRDVRRVFPDDLSPLQHEKTSWLTLLTCQGYDPSSASYRWRVAVRSVLVEVEPDPGSQPGRGPS